MVLIDSSRQRAGTFFASSIAVLAGKGISAMDHLPYSPDLAPADFWPFPELKSVLKGKRSADFEDIKYSVTNILADIPIQDFKNCPEQ
jgi:hypothetical protein